jgi:hypothetical protein
LSPGNPFNHLARPARARRDVMLIDFGIKHKTVDSNVSQPIIVSAPVYIWSEFVEVEFEGVKAFNAPLMEVDSGVGLGEIEKIQKLRLLLEAIWYSRWTGDETWREFVADYDDEIFCGVVLKRIEKEIVAYDNVNVPEEQIRCLYIEALSNLREWCERKSIKLKV